MVSPHGRGRPRPASCSWECARPTPARPARYSVALTRAAGWLDFPWGEGAGLLLVGRLCGEAVIEREVMALWPAGAAAGSSRLYSC